MEWPNLEHLAKLDDILSESDQRGVNVALSISIVDHFRRHKSDRLTDRSLQWETRWTKTLPAIYQRLLPFPPMKNRNPVAPII